MSMKGNILQIIYLLLLLVDSYCLFNCANSIYGIINIASNNVYNIER